MTDKCAEPRLEMNGRPVERKGRLRSIGGSASDDFNSVVANQAVSSGWFGNADTDGAERLRMAGAAVLVGVAPRDEVEGMLAAQLIATHHAAMECFRRAMLPEQSLDARDMNLTQANKLTRSYATLVQTLDKRRGKGQQKVTVEHVHVHQGGQAIVGNVHTAGRSTLAAAADDLTSGSLIPSSLNLPRGVVEASPGVGARSEDDE